MQYTFDKRADRSGGVAWLKDYFTPDAVRAQGMVGYAGAEFEFATCPAFCRGVEQAARRGVFGYTLTDGPYREAVGWWMKEMRGYAVKSDWIVPVHGTIFALATSIRLFTKPGENMIVMSPNYNRYNQAADRLGRGTVAVPLLENEGRYAIDWAGLECAFARPENKLFVLCNPNNPTGTVWGEEELARVAALSKAHGVAVFSDEIFAEVVFEGRTVVPYAKVAGPEALAITCTSMGKVFSLTGVNHANLIIENDALREAYIARRNADHFGSVDPMVYAGMVSAYTPEGRDWVCALREYLWDNILLLEDFLRRNLPRAVMKRPEGTFVVWVDYSAYGSDRPELERLLREDGLFAGDGGEEYFGKPACVRYSLAVPRPELEKTLARVERALQTAPKSCQSGGAL